jgi:CRISPR-associated endoribonuclease Cas6
MPAKIELYYRSVINTPSLPDDLFPLMKALHSKIRKGLHSCDPQLLQDIQTENQKQRIFQPYSLEPIVETEPGLFRITLKLLPLNAKALLEAFVQWWNTNRQILHLDTFRLAYSHMSEIQSCEPEQLVAHLPDNTTQIAFDFLSPLVLGPGNTHAQQAQRKISAYSLPVPDRLIAHLLVTWNHFYPSLALPETLIETADLSMEIVHMQQGCVETVRLGQHIHKRGFKGLVVYTLPPNAFERQQLLTLAHFAPWSGVGRQATLGLGWTRTTAWVSRQ